MTTESPTRRFARRWCVLLVLLLEPVLGFADTNHVDTKPEPAKVEQVCRRAALGYAGCHALRRVTSGRSELAAMAASHRAVPAGLGPADIRDAYKLDTTGGRGVIIAIVAAYDAPTIGADLNTYRTQFGLPSCTVSNGCFQKVDEFGGTALPVADAGWAAEISQDVELVSAVCPNCKILLVEADAPDFQSLGTAVNTAVAMGAAVVVNGYGGPEDRSTPGADADVEERFYKHPGVAMVAPSGDDGFAGGIMFPASSRYVTAVGGTTLVRANNARGWSETVWNGTGSGCSFEMPKPAFETDTVCTHRMLADVSAVADPVTGVAVYDSFQALGWAVYGGTEVATAIIGGIYALASPARAGDYPVQYPYAARGTGALFDVTDGSNGTCNPSYACRAQDGYDGPSGLGSPHGSAAFAPPAIDFSFDVPSVTGTTPRDGSIQAVISTHAVSGQDGTVALSARDLPPGATATFSPTMIPAGSSSTMTITVSSGTPEGIYAMTIVARGSSATHWIDYSLTVAPPLPAVTIGVTPPAVTLGQTATITWSSTNATSCTGSGDWAGSIPANGSRVVSPDSAGNYDYVLTCSGPGGSASSSRHLSVALPPPTITLTVTPTRIGLLQPAVLSWTSTNASSCAASGSWSGARSVSGSIEVHPLLPGTYQYTLTCTGPAGAVNATATLRVVLLE
ncbi:MAG TPA: hypothetical protein VK636_04650 [Gemmatimonadaceae bacterium]|nr:hypothetical protein [Gemmatimonadaceae bacterium]